MTSQHVSYGLKDAQASTVVPPGRYAIMDAKFIDDFDYQGSQKPGTAAVLTFQDADGRTWTQEYGVGDKTRIWPDPSTGNQQLAGAALSESSTFHFLLKNAVQVAGLPESRFWNGEEPAFVNTIFAGVWGDWTNVVPEGRAKTRKNSKTGQDEQAIGILVPTKFFMDGQAAPASTPAPATQAPPLTPVAPPPAAPAAPAAAPPPPPTEAAPPPPAASTPLPPNGVASGIEERYGNMLRIAQEMIADTSTPNTRSQLMTEVFGKLDVTGLGEPEAAQARADAMNAVMGGFTDYMTANGIKMEGEVLSV